MRWGELLRGALILATVVATATACRDDQSPKPASTTAAAIAAADPSLIIFTTLAEGIGPADAHPRLTVTVYDTIARATRHSFDIGDGATDSPRKVVAAGNKLVVNFGDRIVRYDLDGSNPHELRHANAPESDGGVFPPGFIDIAASPDGTKLALTEETRDLCPPPPPTPPSPGATPGQCRTYAEVTRASIIDVATGAEMMSVPQSDPGFDPYHGQAAEITWRDDGTGFVVAGLTYSEAGGSIATVTVHGTVRTFGGQHDALAPNARVVSSGDGDYVCGLGGTFVQHQIVVRGLDAGPPANTVGDRVLNLSEQEWSPDSSELLYTTTTLTPSASNPGCVDEDETSIRWFRLPTNGSPPIPVSDIWEARRRWYGNRMIEFRCAGQLISGRFTMYTDPACPDPNASLAPVDAYVDGTKIGSGLRWHTVQLIPDAPAGAFQ